MIPFNTVIVLYLLTDKNKQHHFISIVTGQLNNKQRNKKSNYLGQHWICYRCHLTFEANSIASIHTALSGHPTSIID